MNDAMRKEISDSAIALKLASYVLDDARRDPDGDMSLLARQYLRQREQMVSIVRAAGGRIFVPARAISMGAEGCELHFSSNAEAHGYDVCLLTTESK